MLEEILEPIYDTAKSFYKKAHVQYDGNKWDLISYTTKVATVYKGEKTPIIYGMYSATTLRHIKEFLRQQGLETGSKSQLEKMYM